MGQKGNRNGVEKTAVMGCQRTVGTGLRVVRTGAAQERETASGRRNAGREIPGCAYSSLGLNALWGSAANCRNHSRAVSCGSHQRRGVSFR